MRCLRTAVFFLPLFLTAGAAAHDIPVDITVHAWVVPAGQQLRLLVRLPLKAIRDLDFPEQKTGYLDIAKLAPLLPGAATVSISELIEVYENGTRVPKPRIAATQVSLESDRSFTSFEQALAHVSAPPLPNSANVVWNQVMLDVLLEYPIHSDRSAFSIRPGLEGLAARVVTVVRFQPSGSPVRAYEFQGDPGILPLDPGWIQAAARFVRLGFRHILDGTDHLLFLFCLVIPFRRIRPLLVVVTAFTVAHSITLIASAYNFVPGVLWFPPLIETLIAVSILYMALENIAGAAAPKRRWIVAFAFGLVHGFGFVFGLRQTLQFAGSHLLTALLSFNLGIELGQLLVLSLLVPLLALLFRFVVAERMGTVILSALVAHVSWHWMADRWDRLRQFPLEWPAIDAALLAGWMRYAMWIVIVCFLAWLVFRLRARAAASGPSDQPEAPQPAAAADPDPVA